MANIHATIIKKFDTKMSRFVPIKCQIRWINRGTMAAANATAENIRDFCCTVNCFDGHLAMSLTRMMRKCNMKLKERKKVQLIYARNSSSIKFCLKYRKRKIHRRNSIFWKSPVIGCNRSKTKALWLLIIASAQSIARYCARVKGFVVYILAPHCVPMRAFSLRVVIVASAASLLLFKCFSHYKQLNL